MRVSRIVFKNWSPKGSIWEQYSWLVKVVVLVVVRGERRRREGGGEEEGVSVVVVAVAPMVASGYRCCCRCPAKTVPTTTTGWRLRMSSNFNCNFKRVSALPFYLFLNDWSFPILVWPGLVQSLSSLWIKRIEQSTTAVALAGDDTPSARLAHSWKLAHRAMSCKTEATSGFQLYGWLAIWSYKLRLTLVNSLPVSLPLYWSLSSHFRLLHSLSTRPLAS